MCIKIIPCFFNFFYGTEGIDFMQCRKLQQLKTRKKIQFQFFFATAEHRGDNWKLINEFMGFFRVALRFEFLLQFFYMFF